MTAWDDVRHRLEHELAGLGGDAFVVVGEPQPPAEPRRGLLRRREQPVTRYVQVRAAEHDLLFAECVGATSFGGDWDVSPVQHERLCGLGWYVPGQDNPWEVEQTYPNYFRYDDVSQRAELARVCVESLETLGVDPGGLAWQPGH